MMKRTLGKAILIIGLLVLLYFKVSERFVRPRSSSPAYTACASNMKNIGTALDEYFKENGRYPERLSAATAQWKSQPSCPNTPTDATPYHDTYEVNCAIFCPEAPRIGMDCSAAQLSLRERVLRYQKRTGRWPQNLNDFTSKSERRCSVHNRAYRYFPGMTYSYYCKGNHHPALLEDNPSYDGLRGARKLYRGR